MAAPMLIACLICPLVVGSSPLGMGTVPADVSTTAPAQGSAFLAKPSAEVSTAPRRLQQQADFDNENAFLNDYREGASIGGSSKTRIIVVVLVQLLFGVLYYITIVSKYPEQTGPAKPEAEAIQAQWPINACVNDCPSTNCLFSVFCHARAAHTTDKTGALSYLPALIFFSCCPCLTLFLVNACTDHKTKLGAKQQDCLEACCCALFCPCCVIVQDAICLDINTGAKTGCFTVTQPAGVHAPMVQLA